MKILQNEKILKTGVHYIKTSNIGLGLEKIAKTVIVHVKANKKVYMQVGKFAVYGVMTVAGLNITGVVALASGLDGLDARASDLFGSLADLCAWVIIIKAIWDMALCVVHGEVKKAPSIGISYLLIIATLYALPFGLEVVKDVFRY